MFLKNFLETAEKHFFVGFKVHFYVFTDRPKEVPMVKMAADRQVRNRFVNLPLSMLAIPHYQWHTDDSSFVFNKSSRSSSISCFDLWFAITCPPADGAFGSQLKTLAGDFCSQDGARPEADRGGASQPH